MKLSAKIFPWSWCNDKNYYAGKNLLYKHELFFSINSKGQKLNNNKN